MGDRIKTMNPAINAAGKVIHNYNVHYYHESY
jgi:hypothetical protein